MMRHEPFQTKRRWLAGLAIACLSAGGMLLMLAANWSRLQHALVAAVLRSPLNFLLAGTITLISFRGRRSGKWFTTPVSYVRDGDRVLVLVGHPERKRWWRNLRQPASVRLRLAGQDVGGIGRVLPFRSAELLDALRIYLRHHRLAARSLGVRLGMNGSPSEADLARAAEQAVLVQVQLVPPMGGATTPHPAPYALRDGLAIYRFGAGQPLLFMPYPHGLGVVGDPRAMALVDGLVGCGREVLTFDPPGAGQSTRPTRLGMPEMLACADETLAACGVEGPVDVFGHSQGGVAALAFALERPARVRRLVLANTSSGGPAFLRAPGAIWNRSHPDFWRFGLLALFHLVWRRRAVETLMNNLIFRGVTSITRGGVRRCPTTWPS